VNKTEELSEELQNSLRDIVNLCEGEDDNIRKSQMRIWKKNEEFWHGVQYLFWSERDETWVSPLDVTWRNQLSEDELQELGPFYDFVVDIFKAHGESIVAALSSQVPAVRFIPDDADDQADVLTAKTYSKIADLICRHNNAKMLFIQSLFYAYINGIMFSYRYKDTDAKYGTVVVPEYGVREESIPALTCPDCGIVRDSNEPGCACGSVSESLPSQKAELVPYQTGERELPKSRAKLDIFGGLHVKVPYYARKQEDCGYLILFTDQPKDFVKSQFSEKADQIEGEGVTGLERFSRSEYSYSGGLDEAQRNLVTVTRAWLRPSSYWRELDNGKRKELERLFPKGCFVTFVGKDKVYIKSRDESLDDCWTIGKVGLSTFIHSDPLCRPLVPIQELRNQFVNLSVDLLEHGVPSSFADKDILDWDSYGKFEAAPGFIYPAKRRGNMPMADGFFTEPKAAFPRELPGFIRALDQDAQFSTGSFPSIYGGPSEGKSRTYSEYAASRQMALQRLSIAWVFVVDWWMRTIEGAVRLYAGTVIEDERYVKKDGDSYINVWIRRSEMTGKIGGVEPEGSDAFPVSLAQKRDLIFRLIELNNSYINTALYMPENVQILSDILALTDLKLPGENQRVKQVLEINELCKAGPVEPEPGNYVPTVLPEPEVDDDEVHISVLRNFLSSINGIDLRRSNPQGYLNCLSHLRLHLQSLQLKSVGQFGESPPGQAPETTDTTEE